MDIADEGGYDANFLTEVSTDLKCVVCHYPLKNPVQVIECGHRFCKECFERMKGYSTRRNTDLCCPLDRMSINPNQVFADKGVARTVLSLPVRCTNVTKGCMWVNDLRDLQSHVDTDCDYTKVKCANQSCQKQIQRNMLQDHLVQCPSQENRCDVDNERKIKDLIDDLSSRLLICEIHMKEKDERLVNCEKELKETRDKLALKDGVIESMKLDIERLSCVDVMGCFQWTINDYDTVKWSDHLMSPYFYSSYSGYKCRLFSQWHGPKRGRMGLFFHICQGDNDDNLVWPFPMKVRLQSIDCNGVVKESSVSCLTGPSEYWERQMNSVIHGVGNPDFLKMPQLTKYVRNNKLLVRCFLDH